MPAITRNGITCDFCTWCNDPRNPDPRIHWDEDPRSHTATPVVRISPALEYHFTLDETLEIMGRLRTYQLLGARWYITQPAAEDLFSEAFAMAFADYEGHVINIHDFLAGRTAATLWGYPLELIPGNKAVVYFGQGVL